MNIYEIEQKYRVDDLAGLEKRLEETDAVEEGVQQHADTYYNHPSRDFAETQEAFRVRRVDGKPMVTYKGAKLPGTVKARRELEWRLDPGDPDGSKMEELLSLLSFRRVAVVEKQRRSFRLSGEFADFAVVIDQVAGLGLFAEIELLVGERPEIERAQERVGRFAHRLGLNHVEPRSYLRMILETNLAG